MIESKPLVINAVLLGIGDDGGLLVISDLAEQVAGDDLESWNCDEGLALGIREGLGGHEADAEAGVTAGPPADGDGVEVFELPSKLIEQCPTLGDEVAGVF